MKIAYRIPYAILKLRHDKYVCVSVDSEIIECHSSKNADDTVKMLRTIYQNNQQTYRPVAEQWANMTKTESEDLINRLVRNIMTYDVSSGNVCTDTGIRGWMEVQFDV